MDGVPGITVAQVVLNEAQIVALVGQDEPAGVPQGVRMDAGQAGALGRHGDQVIDGLTGERLAALGEYRPLRSGFCPAAGRVGLTLLLSEELRPGQLRLLDRWGLSLLSPPPWCDDPSHVPFWLRLVSIFSLLVLTVP